MNRLMILIFLTSCAHSVHQMHFSDYKPHEKLTSGKMIKAEASQHTIMGFVKETNYIDEARKKLMDQCQEGEIQGVTTRTSTDLGFFNWTNKVQMQGLCIVRR